MKKRMRNGLHLLTVFCLTLVLSACVATDEARLAEQQREIVPPAVVREVDAAPPAPVASPQPGQLPVRFLKPTYLLESVDKGAGLGGGGELTIPIGADISSNTGPVPLRDILKRLAALKKMNISWASDVDQMALVDVDIRAEDDFFKAIENLLRQKDYFHEVQGNTIVVKYRETKKFHVAMPFIKSTYETGVGGDVLGSGGIGGASSAGKMTGSIQLKSSGNEFDIWANISKNLDQILGIWEETVAVSTPAAAPAAAGAAAPPGAPAAGRAGTTAQRNVKAGKGYYSIDKPVGLITVTAPRPLVEKIEDYLNSLKKELFRQVVIEAKIVEVIINDTEKKGIDWSKLLDVSVNLEMFGPSGIIYQAPQASELPVAGIDRMVSKVEIPPHTVNPFRVLISALETQGPTNILANPKISVLNGQPALITVGENVRFIAKVETTVDEGVVSSSVTTDSIMSGLGMSVIATIIDKDEVVLSLTPVTSSLTKMDERTFGGGNLMVQLPTVSVREMNTIVQVKNGDILMVGGLIDNVEADTVSRVPLLGEIPGLSRIFSHSEKSKRKKELVILLQPRIL